MAILELEVFVSSTTYALLNLDKRNVLNNHRLQLQSNQRRCWSKGRHLIPRVNSDRAHCGSELDTFLARIIGISAPPLFIEN